MSDDELGDLDWLTWEWVEELAQSGSDNPEDGDCWISEPTKEGATKRVSAYPAHARTATTTTASDPA